jgi:peptide/nickel transport system substrate-binding protein
VWTFKIRQGVKFNDGTPMTVDDVVYSFKTSPTEERGQRAVGLRRHALPGRGAEGGRQTVAFHLDAPNNGFVDAVSEDNYNMIIVPKQFRLRQLRERLARHRPVHADSYTPNVGATFVRNPHYWGKAALPSKIDFTFYPTRAPMAAALQAGSIDAMDQFSVAISPQLLTGAST